MNLEQLLLAMAHEDAAEVLRSGHEPPERETKAVVIVGRLRLVLSASTYDGPAHLYLVPGVDPTNFPGAIVLPTTAPPAPARLSALQRLILSVLDRQAVRKADWIAAKTRRRNDGNLRNALAGLVKLGLLAKGPDGYGYRLA